MLTLLGLTTVWILGYSALCAIRPFGPCRRCKGAGELQRRKAIKTCPRCHGDRHRLRVGRRIHNRASALHRAGTR